MSGYVWLDMNQDGIKDANESGMTQIVVSLVYPDLSTTMELTDSDGHYSFENLIPGAYTVSVTEWDAGLEPSTENTFPFMLNGGGINATYDFGFKAEGAEVDCALILSTNNVTPATCGFENGEISLVIEGGVLPYTITVNDEDPEEYTFNDILFSDLAAGTYEIVIADSEGCGIEVTNVVQTGETEFVQVVNDESACGENDGTFEVQVLSGSDDYSLALDQAVGNLQGLLVTGLSAGTYSGTFTDAECGSFPVNFTIECEEVDDPPVGGTNQPPCADTLFYCIPQLTGNVEFCVPDCDPDGDNLTIIEHTGSLFGCSIHIDNDTCFTYTPLPAFIGEDYIELIVCDDGSPIQCVTWAFWITVGDDCGPMALNDTMDIASGVSTDVLVLDNDVHPLEQNFTITDATDGFGGTVQIDPTGSFLIYTPNDGFVGGDSFSYTICDDDGNCDSALVVVFVGDGPPPSDCEADAGVVTPPSDLCYAPDEASAAPTVSGDNTDDGFVYLWVLTTDLTPGDGITYDIVSLNTSGSFDFAALGLGAGIYNVHGFNYEGSLLEVVDLNPMTGEDVLELINNETICADLIVPGYTIEVSTLCDGEECLESIELCAEPGIAEEICFEFCEILGTNHLIDSLSSTYLNCSVSIFNDTCVTYTAVPGYLGLDSVVAYSCSPLNGICDTIWAYINVGCAAPLALDDQAEAQTGVPTFIPVLDNDADPCDRPLELTLFEEPSNGVVSLTTNGFDYTADDGFEGQDEFMYIICNDCSAALCDTAVVSIGVGEEVMVEDPMLDLQPDIAWTPFDVGVMIDVLDNDGVDGLTITDVSEPQNGTVEIIDGVITYVPNDGYVGDDYFYYTACDDNDDCGTTFVQVLVFDEEENQAPVAENDYTSADAGEMTEIFVLVNDVDPEGNAFTITEASIIDGCGEITISDDGTYLILTTPEDCSDNVLIDYTICEDGTENCDDAQVLVAVNTPIANTPPIAVNDTIEINDFVNGQTFNVSENDSDPEGGSLTYILASGPHCAEEFEMNDDGLSLYLADPEDCPEDLLMYIVCDDGVVSLCDTAFVLLQLAIPESFVDAQVDVVQTTLEEPVVICVGDNDIGSNLSIDEGDIGEPSNGTVVLNEDGCLEYTPDDGFTGTDYFFYSICDDQGVCDMTLVSVEVLDGENLPPNGDNDTYTFVEGFDAIALNVLNNDNDPENGELTIGSVFDIDEACADSIGIGLDSTMLFFFPVDGFEGECLFGYTVCDNEMACDTAYAVVGMGMDPSNLAPLAEEDILQTEPETEIEICVLTNDSDPNVEDELTFIISSFPNNGTIETTDDDCILYTPDAGFAGFDFLTYVVCDDGLPVLCDTSYVQIEVTDDIDTTVEANDDEASGEVNEMVEVDLFENDIVTPTGTDFIITIIDGPMNGTVEVLNNGDSDVSIVYMPDIGFSGMDTIEYELCAEGECDTAFIVITIESLCELDIPNGISPNNDGIMDEFMIPGIEECYPGERELRIYNRWGNELYSKVGFSSMDSWDGTWEGEDVPDGTYFYMIIATGSDELEDIDEAGYLEVFRQIST